MHAARPACGAVAALAPLAYVRSLGRERVLTLARPTRNCGAPLQALVWARLEPVPIVAGKICARHTPSPRTPKAVVGSMSGGGLSRMSVSDTERQTPVKASEVEVFDSSPRKSDDESSQRASPSAGAPSAALYAWTAHVLRRPRVDDILCGGGLISCHCLGPRDLID